MAMYHDLTDIDKLVSNPDLKSGQAITLQYWQKKPDDAFWKALNDRVLKHYPNVSLRFYGYEGDKQYSDLSFLENVPSCRNLKLELMELPVSELQKIPQFIDHLDHFTFMRCRKVYSVVFLEKFKGLQSLSIEGKVKNPEFLCHFQHLKALYFYGVKFKQVNFFTALHDLRSFRMIMGTCPSYGFLADFPKLENLELAYIRNLEDLSFIQKMPGLKALDLYALKKVEKIPDFPEEAALERMSIEKLPIVSLKALSSLRKLEELFVYECENMPVSEFEALNLNKMKRVEVYYNSVKKNKAIEEILAQGSIE